MTHNTKEQNGTIKGVVSVMVFLFMFLALSFPLLSSASTIIPSGELSGNITWLPVNGPYVVNYIFIPQGSSLTITPGTVVKIAGTVPWSVYGSLKADGVTFTSYKDDTISGDTNGDGVLTSPQSGDWANITAEQGGIITITNSTFSYGGAYAGYDYQCGGYCGVTRAANAQLVNHGGTIDVSTTLFDHSTYEHATQISGTTTIINTELKNGGTGVLANAGTLTLRGNRFTNNDYGFRVQQTVFTLERNGFIDTPQNNMTADSLFISDGQNAGNGTALSISGTLNGLLTLKREGFVYALTGTTVAPNAMLIIDPGAITKFGGGNASQLHVFGSLTIGATSSPLWTVITSISDDSIGGDTNNDGMTTVPLAGDWGNITAEPGGVVNIFRTVLRYGGAMVSYDYYCNALCGAGHYANSQIANHGGEVYIDDARFMSARSHVDTNGGTTTIANSEFTASQYSAIVATKGALFMNGSSIHDLPPDVLGMYVMGGNNIVKGNWWGDASGPTVATNLGGSGVKIYGTPVEYVPWLTTSPNFLTPVFTPPSTTTPVFATTTPPVCITECNSNVLFLPGIMGSTLYRYNPTTDISTKVWEPSLGSAGTEQVEQLYMNPELATSNNADVYAKEILNEDWSGSNYYKTFSKSLNAISGPGKSINAWEGIPYDWRLAPETIVTNGKKEGDYISYLNATSTPFIIQELKRLASTSKTGKVTIVAHSYGGLVTKALINALGTTTAQSLIDAVVFVAVPQVGTPQAIAGMLYGKNQDLGFGFVVTQDEAQSFAATLPMAYGLLPSRGYFRDVREQVVMLPTEEYFAPWRAEYGRVVGNWDEMHSFLTRASDRTLLNDLRVVSGIPPQLNHTANMRVLATHNTLDAWTPPGGIIMTQIAGWGIPKTVKGVTLDGVPNAYCTASDIVCQNTRSWSLVPGYDTTMDGDGTVVTPSALWTSASMGVQNYWVNLKNYNKDNRVGTLLGLIGPKHGDILEVPELTNFITDLITKSIKPLVDYTYLSTEVPTDSNPRLRYSLHSPLTLDVYDDRGRHTGVSTTTGLIEEQIPGTYFSQIGEVKYLFTNASTTSHIILSGYATGTFTFAVEELRGDTVIASTTWKDVPTTPNTKVTITTQSDITTISPMQIDMNGDGIFEYTLKPKLNEVIPFDRTPPEIMITFSTSTNAIIFSGIDESGTTTLSTTTAYPIVKKHQRTHKGIATTTLIVKDEVGNETQLTYTEKLPSAERKDAMNLVAISYNGVVQNLSTSTLKYQWKTNKAGAYTMFSSAVTLGATTTKARYNAKKHITVITTKPIELHNEEIEDESENDQSSKTTLPGFVIVKLQTKQGSFTVSY